MKKLRQEKLPLQQLRRARRLALLLAGAIGSWLVVSPAAGATLECGAVQSSILAHPVRVCVALPESYASSAPKRYPMLYFLHGLFENERSWDERGGQQVLEELQRQGQLGEFLVVLPDGGRSFYVNSLDGRERYEDFFIKELVPFIDGKYRTIADRSARGISGTSMGGYGALHLGMSHPEVFGSASAHSAALLPRIPNPLPSEGRWRFYARILERAFGSPLDAAYWDANNPLTLAESPSRFANLKLYFDCGESDRYGFEEGSQILHEKLAARGFPHDFALRPGDHGWGYLSRYMKYSLLFHWRWFNHRGGTLAGSRKEAGTR